ncbi:MAG: hypothetical protein RMM28_00600 [Thermoleophilia bacterium]|nr:hypothetical protein [Gaiellaceae bacterium]MDW8337624.1 hypothetical protein [Thermoleophilia bacterium]
MSPLEPSHRGTLRRGAGPIEVLAAAAASALLLWIASPAVGIGALAWVALVPAALVALGAPETRGARAVVPLAVSLHLELQLVPALPFGIAENQWGEPPLPVLVGDSPMAAAALVYVPALGALLYALRFPQPWPAGAARSGLVAVWVPALAWAALDLLRARYDPAGLWGGLYVSQHSSAAAALAAVGGPGVLTALQVAVGFGAALLVLRRRSALPATVSVAVALGATVVVAERLGTPAGEPVVVAAAQPGYDTSEWEYGPVRYFAPGRRDLARASSDVVADLGALARKASGRGAEIVVWPEAVVWVDPYEEAGVRRELAMLAAETKAVVVVPFFDPARAESAVLAALPSGRLTEPQPKQRPMWFLGERARDAPARPLAGRSARLGVLLGVDVQDAGSARALAAAGATLLASSTHDWAELATQQVALSRIAAAAVRLPLVRADWRYASTIVDTDRRGRADGGLGRSRTVLVATVHARSSDAPYLWVGDLLGWAGVVVLAVCWALRRGSRLRAGA